MMDKVKVYFYSYGLSGNCSLIMLMEKSEPGIKKTIEPRRVKHANMVGLVIFQPCIG